MPLLRQKTSRFKPLLFGNYNKKSAFSIIAKSFFAKKSFSIGFFYPLIFRNEHETYIIKGNLNNINELSLRCNVFCNKSRVIVFNFVWKPRNRTVRIRLWLFEYSIRFSSTLTTYFLVLHRMKGYGYNQQTVYVVDTQFYFI